MTLVVLVALATWSSPASPRFAGGGSDGLVADVPAVSAPEGGATAEPGNSAPAPEAAASPAAALGVMAPAAATEPVATAASDGQPAPAAAAAPDVAAAPVVEPAATALALAAPVAASTAAPANAAAAAPPTSAALPDPASIDRTYAIHPDPVGSTAHRGADLQNGLAVGSAPAPADLSASAAGAVDPFPLPPGTPKQQAINAQTVAMGGLLPSHRILTYYGHPHDPNMGILGEYEKPELVQILRTKAAEYEAVDPSRPVIPAFEVIATVAQGWPAEDDTYLLNTDLETLVEYADFAEANDMLLFLDLQIGRNTVPAEIEKVRSLLERPHVHLALDPEFAIAEGQVPGTHIGELTAEQIREAQDILAAMVNDLGLPPKILIIHQFREDMILGKERLGPVAGVQLVIESDGFGAPGLKTQVYDILIGANEKEFSGIKHFYRQDKPLMTPAETLALEPSPLLIIYQ
jgi:hypothetical protein